MRQCFTVWWIGQCVRTHSPISPIHQTVYEHTVLSLLSTRLCSNTLSYLSYPPDCVPTHSPISPIHQTVFQHTLLSLLPTTLLTPLWMSNVPHYIYIYNCLPEDEPTRFETCRRHQKLSINLENLCIWLVCVV
jgi:hypothetical protein